MTVSTTIRSRTYSGNGSTTVFAWNFKLTEESQMHVYIAGVEVLQGDATYPWSLSGTIPGESGDVTFTGTVPPSGTDNVLLRREMEFTQEVDYQANDPFPAETHEGALDKLTLLAQENQDNVEIFTIRTKIIEIGDWNMVTTVSKNVTHGLDLTKIRSLSAMIRDDADTAHVDLNVLNTSESSNHGITSNAAVVVMYRGTGGVFDNASYDSTSYNRGWVVIQYID